MRISRRTALAMIGLAAAATAHAQGAASYPSKPVKVIVPFTAGGPADSVTRFIAQRMSEAWGQPVVVENRVGAGGREVGPRWLYLRFARHRPYHSSGDAGENAV